jgi:DNA-binding SARP family transcriptional activator
LQIRLLGVPEIVASDGRPCPVRGLQAWAVLARVLLSDRPLSRRQLAAELFPETVDPLGALRWCLAALRRALGPEALTGDPIVPNLPSGCRIDALSLDDESFDPTTAGELLEDNAPDACGAEFETWLLVEQARLAARLDARLRRSTLDALARGDAAEALRLAGCAASRQPFDEGVHILLVRALVLSGNPEAARRHAEKMEVEFLRELGEPPSSALRSAARGRLDDTLAGPSPDAVVRALLQSGSAALKVGAVDAGLDNLRRSATLAEAIDNRALQAEVLTELGTALIHSVRGQDDEGVIHLRRAEELALQSQNRTIGCWAVLEQCYAEALAGRRPDAARLSERAFGLADDDPDRLAAAHAFAGFNLADWGRYAEADRAYEMSLAFARKADAARREGWALGLGAWGKLRGGNPALAAEWAREAITLCNRLEWFSFRPWPEAVLAEAEFTVGGDPACVRHRLEPTLAMACQLSDPCWEAAACRVIALCHQQEAAPRIALGWLDRAAQAFAKVTDPYAALLLRIQFDRARFTLATDPKGGQTLVRELLVSAARLHADGELDAALALRSGTFNG